jgi:hypothetical protein
MPTVELVLDLEYGLAGVDEERAFAALAVLETLLHDREFEGGDERLHLAEVVL